MSNKNFLHQLSLLDLYGVIERKDGVADEIISKTVNEKEDRIKFINFIQNKLDEFFYKGSRQPLIKLPGYSMSFEQYIERVKNINSNEMVKRYFDKIIKNKYVNCFRQIVSLNFIKPYELFLNDHSAILCDFHYYMDINDNNIINAVENDIQDTMNVATQSPLIAHYKCVRPFTQYLQIIRNSSESK